MSFGNHAGFGNTFQRLDKVGCETNMYIVHNVGVLLLGTSHGVGKEFCKPRVGMGSR